MHARLLLLFTWVFITCTANAQSTADDAELNKILAIKNSAERLEALQVYAKSVLFVNPELGMQVTTEVNRLARKLRNKKALMNVYNWMGLGYYFLSEPDTAFMYFDSLLVLSKNQKDTLMRAKAHGNRGMLYERKSDFSRAFKEYGFALKQADKLGDSSLMASSYGNMGNVSVRLDRSDDAVIYFKKALDIFEKLGNKRAAANQYNSLSQAYDGLRDTVNREKCLLEAEKRYREINDLRPLATVLTNLSTLELDRGNSEKAYVLAEEALKLKRQFNDLSGSSVLLINISILYNQRKEYSKSMAVLKEALELSQKEGDLFTRSQAMLKMAAVYRKTGKIDQAYEMILDYLDVKDSLLGENTRHAIAEYQQKYESEKKQYEIDRLNKNKQLDDLKLRENQLTIAQQKSSRNILIGFLAFAAIILVLVVYGFIQKRKSNRVLELRNQQIEQKNEQLSGAYSEIHEQKEELEQKNKEILDSISYAKRLQEAILPPQKLVKEYLEDSFIIYKPKDIVAGDFYWMENLNGSIYFAAADCTGHGVPGAMVSVVCSNALNRAVKEFQLTDTGKILDKVRELVIETFAKSESEVKDGMDISLCGLTFSSKKSAHAAKLQWSGANNPLFLYRKSEKSITEIKGNKQPVGQFANPKPFESVTLDLHSGDALYIFTDGFQDQFGGPKGKKFKASNLKSLFESVVHLPMAQQKTETERLFEEWKGSLEQIDDVCIIGVRI